MATTTVSITIPLMARRGLSDRELIELLIAEAYQRAQGTLANRGPHGFMCVSLALVDRSWSVRDDNVPEWRFDFEAETVPMPASLDKLARRAA